MRFPIFGASDDNMGSAAAYAFLSSSHNINWSATENLRQIPLSEDVDLRQWSVTLTTAPGAGTSRTFTLRKNGVATAATVTISGTATTGFWTGTVSFAAGDLIGIEATATGSPAAPSRTAWWTMMDTTGQKALIMGGSNGAPSTSAVNFANLFSDTAFASGASGRAIIVPTGGNLTKLAVATADAAPGAGKQYACSVRLNGASDALTATVSGTSQAASATGSQAVVAGDALQFKSAPTGTPASVHMGWCVTFEPTVNGESFAGYGFTSGMSTSTAEFEQPLGTGAAWGGSEAGHQLRLPGVLLKKLYVSLSAAPGAGTSRTLTMRDNNASSTLTVTISGTATTGNDTAHTVTHTGDQAIGVQSTMSGTPAAAEAHLGYVIVTEQPKSGAGSAITATATLTGSGTTARSGTTTIPATPTLTGAGAAARAGAAALNATTTLTGAGTVGDFGTGGIAATATVTGSGVAARAGTASIVATPTLTGAGVPNRPGTSTIDATVAVSGSGTTARGGAAVITATPTLVGSGGRLIRIREPAGLVLAGDGRTAATITAARHTLAVRPSATDLDVN